MDRLPTTISTLQCILVPSDTVQTAKPTVKPGRFQARGTESRSLMLQRCSLALPANRTTASTIQILLRDPGVSTAFDAPVPRNLCHAHRGGDIVVVVMVVMVLMMVRMVLMMVSMAAACFHHPFCSWSTASDWLHSSKIGSKLRSPDLIVFLYREGPLHWQSCSSNHGEIHSTVREKYLRKSCILMSCAYCILARRQSQNRKKPKRDSLIPLPSSPHPQVSAPCPSTSPPQTSSISSLPPQPSCLP